MALVNDQCADTRDGPPPMQRVFSGPVRSSRSTTSATTPVAELHRMMHLYEGAVMAIGNPCEHRAGLVRTPERARQHLDRASWRNGRTIGAEREMASYTDAGSVPLVLGHWLFAASGVALPFSSHPATQRLVKRLRQSASTFFGDRMNRCPRCQSADIVRSRIRMYERVYFWLTRKPVRTDVLVHPALHAFSCTPRGRPARRYITACSGTGRYRYTTSWAPPPPSTDS